MKEKVEKKVEKAVEKPSTPIEKKISMVEFLGRSEKTKEKHSYIGPAFKAWFTVTKKRDFLLRMSYDEWESLLKKFLNEKVI